MDKSTVESPNISFARKSIPKKIQHHAENIFASTTTLLIYTVLISLGQIRDLFGRLTGITRYYNDITGYVDERGFPPLVHTKDTFFTRRIFNRIRDCWDRPICSPPGAHIDVIKRVSPDQNKTLKPVFNDTSTCLNLGSYNYLGFADNWKETCGDAVLKAVDKYGLASCSSCADAGYTEVHQELEQFVAKFLHKEAALVMSMGYGTNTSALGTLIGPKSLIISDSLNHTSIINGCRGTKETVIKPFKHNDMIGLERILMEAIAYGRKGQDSKEYDPYSRIVVVVEGIYSMEGETVDLRSVVDLCKKYKAYIYVDEAHSIGALGKTGRGICEHAGVDFSEVDVLMGTFSKSFGGMGGYIAASKEIVDFLRARSPGSLWMSSLSPTVATQILTAFKYITGDLRTKDGRHLGEEKLAALHSNANFFRQGLIKMGGDVLGDKDSPIVPLMVYQPTKVAAFSRELLKRNVAVVVVGYPAVPLYEARVRFCISAGHTKEDLKKALKEIEKVCRILNIRYSKSLFG